METINQTVMSDTTIAKHANAFNRIPAEKVTARDAEITREMLGLVLGRPFNHCNAIGPARILARYRLEILKAARPAAR